MRASPKRSFDATLRPRRQVTLPGKVCEALGIVIGDRLELELLDDGVIVRPKRSAALDTLREIQRAFAAADVPATDIEAEARRVRGQLSGRRYGAL